MNIYFKSFGLLISLGLLTYAANSFALLCTQIGCYTGAFISISNKETFTEGEYTLSLNTNEHAYKCQITYDAKKGRCTTSLDESVIEFSIIPDEIKIAAKYFHKVLSQELLPTQIKIYITNEGKKLYSATHSPIYKKHYPNGKQCPAACSNWTYNTSLESENGPQKHR